MGVGIYIYLVFLVIEFGREFSKRKWWWVWGVGVGVGCVCGGFIDIDIL